MILSTRLHIIAALLWLGGLALSAPAGATTPLQWPQFRGPGGNSVAEGQSVPVHFGPSQHLQWKVPLPAGQSSPCIWGDRIFLTAHEGTTLKMLCLNRADGTVLWERTRNIAKIPTYEHIAGNPANSTPATD